MTKCDFCKEGRGNNPSECCYVGYECCAIAAERFLQYCISKNKRTFNHNKNVTIKKKTSKNTYNKRKY